MTNLILCSCNSVYFSLKSVSGLIRSCCRHCFTKLLRRQTLIHPVGTLDRISLGLSGSQFAYDAAAPNCPVAGEARPHEPQFAVTSEPFSSAAAQILLRTSTAPAPTASEPCHRPLYILGPPPPPPTAPEGPVPPPPDGFSRHEAL